MCKENERRSKKPTTTIEHSLQISNSNASYPRHVLSEMC